MAVTMSYDEGAAALADLCRDAQPGGSMAADGRNEAETRLHLVDRILACLGWDLGETGVEKIVAGSRYDYVCPRGKGRARLIVEAKKEALTFTVPAGSERRRSIPQLVKRNPDLRDAMAQVSGYCRQEQVAPAAVCNGRQLVAFLGNRLDNVAPLDGQALVFPSLEEMRDDFESLWNALSPVGLDAGTLHALLVATAEAPYAKLSARLGPQRYPGVRRASDRSLAMGALATRAFIDERPWDEVDADVVRRLYVPTPELSAHVSSLESLVVRPSDAADVAAAATGASRARGGEIARLAGQAGGDDDRAIARALPMPRSPVLVFGDAGAGKSTFVRFFVRVGAAKAAPGALVLYADLGEGGPDGPAARDGALAALERDLVERHGIDVDDADVVARVHADAMRRFENSPDAKLFRDVSAPDYARAKAERMRALQHGDRARHLGLVARDAAETRGGPLIVFLDNVDRRQGTTPEVVLQLAQEIAKTWRAATFLTIRVSTFHASRQAGIADAYFQHAVHVHPPQLKEVVNRRLGHATQIVKATGPDDPDAPALRDLIDAARATLVADDENAALLDDLAGGNLREGLRLVTELARNGHLDPHAAGRTRPGLALHELVGALAVGRYLQFEPNPAESPIVNLFDVTTRTPAEHFALPCLLAFLHDANADGEGPEFLEEDLVRGHLEGLGFTPGQAGAALLRATTGRLAQVPDRGAGVDPLATVRLTRSGFAHLRTLCRLFAYLDVIAVDVRVTDLAVHDALRDVHDRAVRRERATLLVDYLDRCWQPLADKQPRFDWPDVRDTLREAIRDGDAAVRRGRRAPDRRAPPGPA